MTERAGGKISGVPDDAMVARQVVAMRQELPPGVALHAVPVFVELAQNIQRHRRGSADSGIEWRATANGVIVEAFNSCSLVVAEAVRERFAMYAGLTPEQLRILRKTRLRQPRESRGAGVGLIEICRHTKKPPEVEIFNVENRETRLKIRCVIQNESIRVPALNVPATDVTPELRFDTGSGVLIIRGDSFPENVADFYGRLGEWIDQAIAARQPLDVRFELDYLNTSSTKAVLDLLEALEAYHESGGTVSVEWKASTETMGEAGEDLLDGLTLPTRQVKTFGE